MSLADRDYMRADYRTERGKEKRIMFVLWRLKRSFSDITRPS